MNPLHFSDKDFQQEVLSADKPVLVDFWAEWCQPCKMVGPIVEELAEEYKDRLKVGKMNVDENMDVPSQYGIMSIPTIMIFKNGQPQKTIIGAQLKDEFRKNIEEVLGSV